MPLTGTPELSQMVVSCIHSIQAEMLRKAEERLVSMTRECSSYDEMKQAFLAESNQGQGLWLVSACHTPRLVSACHTPRLVACHADATCGCSPGSSGPPRPPCTRMLRLLLSGPRCL